MKQSLRLGFRRVYLFLAHQLRRFMGGFRVFVAQDRLANRQKALAAANLQLPEIAQIGSPTSVSDKREYRQIVASAGSNEEAFRLFRSHPAYFPILEHVSRDLGHEYLTLLEGRSNLPSDWILRCRNLNLIGGPQLWTYPKIGRFSPTILRYVKVFSDLLILFGPLEHRRFIEVGVGFGGQAAVLSELGQVSHIQLYDLPPVLELAGKFLKQSRSSAQTVYLDGTKPPKAEPADIFISNYAFSELNRELQLLYIENSIARSSMGYITWNALSKEGLQPDDLLQLIRGSKILEERPKTARQNVVIVWGTERAL